MENSGEGFLNVSDTVYQLFNENVKNGRFRRYVREALQFGVTNLRSGESQGLGLGMGLRSYRARLIGAERLQPTVGSH